MSTVILDAGFAARAALPRHVVDTAAAGELLVWRRLTGQPTQDSRAVQLTRLGCPWIPDWTHRHRTNCVSFCCEGPVDDGS